MGVKRGVKQGLYMGYIGCKQGLYIWVYKKFTKSLQKVYIFIVHVLKEVQIDIFLINSECLLNLFDSFHLLL